MKTSKKFDAFKVPSKYFSDNPNKSKKECARIIMEPKSKKECARIIVDPCCRLV
jgi:hypothetical protein